MIERKTTAAPTRLLDAQAVAPDGFLYPERFERAIAEPELLDIRPSMWLCEYEGQTENWARIIREQFPERSVVPFAKHEDNDDVFCFDTTDRGGNPPVLIIHAFTTPGYGLRGRWNDFGEWWLEMQEQHAEWV